MNRNQRINGTDTIQSSIIKLAEGNPGALSVMCAFARMEGGDDLLPFGFYGIMMLDSMGVYGPGIWILYKDVCGENLRKLSALIRAWQLGIVDDMQIHGAAAGDSSPPLDIDAICASVYERLGISAETTEAE